MKKKELFTVSVTTNTYDSFVDNIIDSAVECNSKYVCVANVHMLIEGYRNPDFASVVNNADLITPDGKPLTWGLRLIHGIKQDRVAGMFLMNDVLKGAEERKLPVLFYGSTEEVLRETNKFCKNTYPSLKVAGLLSPPFRELTSEEDEAYVQKINASGARIVFVSLGCPKQEKWMAKMKGRINAVMIGVGAALPVLVGLRKKAPMLLQNAGLEWLFRLCLEPRRLFKRYAVTNTAFVYLLSKEIIRVKVINRLSASAIKSTPASLN